MKIKGRVKYLDFEGGFWGIVDQSGKEWLPINMPEQLKVDGANVEITASQSDVMTMYSWGVPIEITGFHTLPKF